MPFDPVTGVFTRVANSFSNPVVGTTIEPLDADALFDDYDDALNEVTAPIYYADKYGVLGNAGDYTTELQALLDLVKAAGGGRIVLPAGSISISDTLTYSTTGSGLIQGIQIEGQGRHATSFLFSASNKFLFSVETNGSNWQSGCHFKGFRIVNVGGATTSGGISLHMAAYAKIEDIQMISMSGTGVYCTAAGDPTSSFYVHIDRCRFDNIAKTANTWGVDFVPTSGALELSTLVVTNSQFEACGVAAAVANPPTSGGMQWRGLLCHIADTGFTACNNVSLYIPPSGTAYGLTLDNVDFENTTSTIHPHMLVNSGLRGLNARNIEFLNNDSFVCQGGLKLDSTNGAIGNVTIDGVKVRVSTGNNPFVAFTATGANLMVETIRVRNVNWATYDGTGQTRFSGIQFDPIPGQCLLTVSALGTVKLAPTGVGGTMPIRLQTASSEWVPTQIPTAGITAAGLTGLSANTQYYLYLHNGAVLTAPIAPAITLSTSVPVFDSSGYFVKTADATRLFLGSFFTDGAGSIVTTSTGYSWYPPGQPTGQLPATLTNDNALPGRVGEYVESVIAQGSAAALTTATALTLTSISLTAGDWDVDTVASFLPANTTSVTQFVVSLGSVAATLNATAGRLGIITTPANVYNGTTQAQVSLPPYRISVAATTTVYMIVQSTFTVSTNVSYGIIRARRVR